MATDPLAGIGGSYILKPDGTRELVERTGELIPDTTQAPDAPINPQTKPDKPDAKP